MSSLLTIVANKKQDCKEKNPESKYAEWQSLFKNTAYKVDNQGCLCKIRKTKGIETIKLANFTAEINKEIIKDDGQTSQMVFEIEGILTGGKLLPAVNIPSTKFPAMSWPTEYWGASANIYPGISNKDNLRHAIQEAGFNCPREIRFTHTGWRKINGKWVYLHGSGAIGADNITVDLAEANLSNYSLPPVTNIQEAAKTTLECLKLAPPEVTYPMLATIFLAPLCELMKQARCEPAFVLWLSGVTQAGKSTLTGLFLSHFGDFQGKSMPGSFKDTENTIERKAFLLKDIVFVMDDFHPTGSANERRIMEKKAHSLIRGYGDRVARGRMNSDTSLKESYVPRGLCIATAEDLPNLGQSATARLLNIELQRGQIDFNLLTQLQQRVHLLAETMTSYIEWIIPRIDYLIAEYKRVFPILRAETTTESIYGRIPETIASLYIGAMTLFCYLEDIGIINESQRKEELLKTGDILTNLAENQGRSIAEDAPTEKFLTALQELITAKRVTVDDINAPFISADDKEPVGWQDDRYYYLLPGLTYKAVCQFYQQQGGVFSVGEKTLWKHLEAAEKIKVKTDDNKTERTFPKLISGINQYRRVLHLKATALNN